MASYAIADATVAAPNLREFAIDGLHNALINRIAQMPGISTDTPILDLGCGTGAWLNRLAANGFRNLHGIDRRAGKFGALRATFSQADLDRAATLGLEAGAFGLITAIEVIEHLENPGRLYFHVSKHLARDGIFLMTTPNIHSVLCRLRFLLTGTLKEFDSKGDPTHIYPVLLSSLQNVLDRHSLAICERFSYPADGKSLTSRPALRAVASVLSLFLPKIQSGDIMCFVIRRS